MRTTPEYAAAIPDDVTRKEMQMIKEMGANFIRLAHYQQSRLVLDLCDELGLLVWEELPWCRGGIGDAAWQQMAKDKLTTMIDQHRNHPSIILWSLGNEDDWPTEYPSVDKDAIRAFMTELRDMAHKQDPTRLTIVPALRLRARHSGCVLAVDLGGVVSRAVYGVRGGAEEAGGAGAAVHPHGVGRGQPCAPAQRDAGQGECRSEGTGRGADERGLDYLPTGGIPRVSVDGDWSETYACNLFDWHLKVQESQDVADGRGAVDLQGLHDAAARGESRARGSIRRASSQRDLDEEGVVLRLPVVLGGGADGAHLRAHVAGALGQGRRAEDGEGVLELRGGRAVSCGETSRWE